MLLIKRLQTRKMFCRFARTLFNKMTFCHCGWESFWSTRHRCINTPLWLDLLVWIILNHEGVTSACVSSLRPSWRQVGFLGKVVSVLVQKHQEGLYSLIQKFLADLKWCLLALLLWRACRMGWAFWPTWIWKFSVKFYESQVALQGFFWFGIHNFLSE